MLAAMAGRAPDATHAQNAGPIAMGHALLRTGTTGIDDCSITRDGDVWITADARIDGRADLIKRLRAGGQLVDDDASHAELIVRAYRVFGEDLAAHLIGDFAFALWDSRSQTLLCARDHFGIRPFYYVDSGSEFAFASDMDALLCAPRVSRELDEISVADFLLFGALQDADRTIYRDIKCLPPATVMRVTRDSARLQRYWELAAGAETRFATIEDYTSRFLELFTQAVTDRLPHGPVALQLSGGLDSTSIAAVAAARSSGRPGSVTGYNLSSRSALPDDNELEYTEIAAEHLGIPLVVQDMSDYESFEAGPRLEWETAMPLLYAFISAHHDNLTRVAQSGARVMLSGHGGDALMAPSGTYYPNLLRSGRVGKLIREVAHHVRHTGSVRGMGLRSAIWSSPPEPEWTAPLPGWIAPDFAKRANLDERWLRGWKTIHDGLDARRQLQQSWLCRNFEAAGSLKLPVVLRYPFYDIRLVEYALGLPNFMVAEKCVMREAMRGRLPEAVRQRPKTHLQGDLVRAIVSKRNEAFLDVARTVGQSAEMINRNQYLSAFQEFCAGDGHESTWTSSLILGPLALENWLSSRKRKID
jgi:asparagine synthase (glutamine-hydrolysing)